MESLYCLRFVWIILGPYVNLSRSQRPRGVRHEPSCPPNTGIVGSNPTQGMDFCVRFFCVCVLCVGVGVEHIIKKISVLKLCVISRDTFICLRKSIKIDFNVL
jgi:hypothetical protein